MSATANLGLVYLDVAQAQKEVSINAGWDVLDAIVVRKTGDTMTGGLKVQRTAVATGTPNPDAWMVTPADTGLAASVDSPMVKLDFTNTRQWATGALANHDSILINAVTLAFVGASVVTAAATVHIVGAPNAGTNCTITHGVALHIQGQVALGNNNAGTAKANFAIIAGQSTTQLSAIYIAPLASGTLTASTEAPYLNFQLARTVTWATGALATQREVLFRAPTYAFVGASTATDVATVAIEGPPAAGANATLTNPFALWIQAGGLRCQGHLNLSGGSAVTAAAGANAGTSPPAPVITAGSNDTRGNITFGTGTGAAAGAQLAVTFNAAYGAAPFVLVVPKNGQTYNGGLFISANSTTGFTLSMAGTPTSGQGNTYYSADYFVFG